MCDQIVQLALAEPEKSARRLAWQFTDQEGYFVSESSVFRLLKRAGTKSPDQNRDSGCEDLAWFRRLCMKEDDRGLGKG